jgi:hypothetical protein
MIEPGTARALTEQVRHVEERLERLLASGWRQAAAEAADLEPIADTLREAGLAELAARVHAVVRAADASAALQAIALAASACQLMRLRLETGAAPQGWRQVPRPKSHQGTTNDTLVPLCRLIMDQNEAWVCAWPARSQIVLLAPPPLELPEVAAPPMSVGVLARLKQSVDQAIGRPKGNTAVWLHRRVRGSITWQGRWPVGAGGDLPLCALDNARWVEADEAERHDQYRDLIHGLAREQASYSGMVGWSGVILSVGELEQARSAEYDWLDPSMAAAFKTHARSTAWALFALAHPLSIPLALLMPGRTPRIVHLVPGLPCEPLATDT